MPGKGERRGGSVALLEIAEGPRAAAGAGAPPPGGGGPPPGGGGPPEGPRGAELSPGDRVGRFQIAREIRGRGLGRVYEARDLDLGRSVALKLLPPARIHKELSAEWIRKEAEAVARLEHPCVVTLFDAGTCPAGLYLVMELLRGETLEERLARGPLPSDEALGISEDIARALAHAHRRGMLHRDLKPANVFLTEDGRVKLLDFGLAHVFGREGTPAYMAPEQARGEEVDERADVWAAGKVLAEMLTGKLPESGAELAEGRLTSMAPRLARAIRAALAPDRALRPRDGGAWLDQLESVRRALERQRVLRRVALLAGLGLLGGLVVTGLAVWRIWER